MPALRFWQVGLLLVVIGAFLFAEQHWLSRGRPEVLSMAPMVSIEQVGIAAVAVGLFVLVFSPILERVRARRARAG